MIEFNNEKIEENIRIDVSAIGDNINRFDAQKLIGSIDTIEKLQSFYKRIPVWPVSADAIIIPNFSLIISVLTILYKTAIFLKII